MGNCGFLLGMGFEYVVHHRQAETAHQFAIELYMAVVLAVTKTMEVIKQMSCLFICQFDNGVLVQRDTATDAVVVRRQQVLKKLIISGKPFYLLVIMCRQIADTIRHRYHHHVVFDNVVAMLVEHKTCLTCHAKQVHAGVAQLTGIHPVEVCRILKICTHILLFSAKIHFFL